ncbi:MAG: NAD(P)H-dependent oxidoreductase [Luteolibacter sp.]|uniref:NADPH-dependent FMN reductase n=1 Tax=Luteolibacter sp. TaxID=1962973 RepID=UPI0032667A5C
MKKPRILVFGGSLRAESYNQKLATIAANAARAAGAEVTLIALRDFRMPLFDEDLEKEEGMPETASRLKGLFSENDGLIIASPEYNSTITAALKNAIDWVSRATAPDEPPLSVLKGKSAAILSASPGGYGGARSLTQLRPFLENIGISVLADQVSIPKAYEAFDADGNLADAAQADAVKALAAALVAKMS